MPNHRIYEYKALSIVADPTEVLWDLETACGGDFDTVLADAAREAVHTRLVKEAETAGTDPPPPLDANDRIAIVTAERELVKGGRAAFKLPGTNDNGPGSGPTAGEVLDLVYDFLNWLEKKAESTATTATSPPSTV